jgi:cytochrome c5
MQLLTAKCVQCHAVPHTGSPLMGRAGDWRAVLAQGEDVTLVNVVQGLRGMPPLGYCSACSEDDLRALIRFIAGGPALAEAGVQ